jgi:hypothetical protein
VRPYRLIDEDFRGLEVAVESAVGVQKGHRQGNIDDDLPPVGRRPPGIENERSGPDPLSGNQQRRVVGCGPADAGVVERRGDNDLLHAFGRPSAVGLTDFTASRRPLFGSKPPLTILKEMRAI